MASESDIIKPHAEAAALIASKPVLQKRVFDQLLPDLRGRAFTITGIESATVMQNVRDQIAALPKGQTWDQSKREIVDQLSPFLGEKEAKTRATVQLRTHGFQAFQASNWRVIHEDDDTTHIQYLATEDDRVRDTHLALNGIILPKGDSFWHDHYPPWEWNCRCRGRGMNVDQVDMEKESDKTRPPEEQLVMEGPMRRKLREGTLIRGTRTFDVLPPEGEHAFRFHPDDLTIPLEDLKSRYDPPVWQEFRQNAQKEELSPGYTTWDWLERGSEVGTPRRGVRAGAPSEEAYLSRQKRSVISITDARGRQLARDVNTGPSMAIDEDLQQHAKGNTVTLNNRSNLPPTPSQYKFAVKHDAAQLRIATKDGTWIVNRPEGGWLAELPQSNDPHELVTQMRDAGIDVRLVDHGAESPSGGGVPLRHHVQYEQCAEPTKEAFGEVLNAIDAVHGDGGLPEIKVNNKVIDAYGEYDPGLRTIALMEASPTPHLTAAHEIGHWIDIPPATHAPDSKFSPALAEWRKAVDLTDAIRNLRAAPVLPDNYRDYLTSYPEIWARAYAQYIAAKSRNPFMLDQVESILGGHTQYEVDAMWTEDDFKAVSAEVEKVLKAKGWL